MSTRVKVAVLAAVLLAATAAYLGVNRDKPASPSVAANPFAANPSAAETPAVVPPENVIKPALTPRYYFDVHNHRPEEITALLERAQDTYENLSKDLRDRLRIVMVLHGPDVQFFASDNYAEYKDLVDLAAGLDAFGLVDLKICLAAARSSGLGPGKFPPFIEIVPYGPAEIERLESDGYVQL